MKKSFHVFFLFVLFAFFAVNAAWAATLCPDPLQEDDNGGCFINLTKHEDTFFIPEGVTSFKVYDDGGKDGNCTSSGYSYFHVAEDYVFLISGTITTSDFGSMSIRDMNASGSPDLILEFGKYREGVDLVENVISSSDEIKISFVCPEGYINNSELDIIVFKKGTERSVNVINDNEKGVLSDASGKAIVGSEVTLTATPVGGNVLADVLIVDENAKPVKVDVNFASNMVSFIMPYSNVTVTPVWTSNLTVEGGLFVNMPKAGTKTMDLPSSVTSFKVYDVGGKDGYSVDVEGGYLVVNAPKNSSIHVVGSMVGNADASNISFSIYDGDINNGEKLVEAHGNNAPISVVGSNVLTFYFRTGSLQMGLDLTVTVYSPKSITVVNPAEGGTVTSDKPNAVLGEKITLSASPAEGYFLKNVVFTDKLGNPIDVENLDCDYGWYSNKVVSFTMPDADIIVTPVFINLATENDLYVNMPKTGTRNAIIPAGITSFKVYDDGGKDGNFTNVVDGYLVLTAPAGYQLLIQGSMKTFCSTSDNCSKGEFVVYDGNVGATEALHKWGNVSNINAYSSGNTMTLYFGFGAAGFNWDTDSGLDFTVSVITQHSVNIADVSGGKISTNKETADEGTTVTLTAAPDKGYILNSISVVGLDGKSVEINNGTWRIGVNTITFSMPKEAVFVSPLFIPANEFSIPKEGRVEVVIPEGVESFNVYDDGGKDGNYSNAADGKLQLTAPENYVFQVSGSATTEVAKDLLTIYDGAYDSDKKLLDEKSGSIDLNGANVLTSSNNIITIKFYSSGIINESGIDLKVTLVKPTYGAVAIAKADDGKIHATINGDYEGTEKLSIPEAIEVDAIDYNRELDVETPVTALLPVTLPAGTTVNADFYTLEKVEQVEGMKWQATMTYIGKNNLPQPNTPYAVILPKGQTKLEFDLKGNKATVQTGDINKVCGLSDCTLDENGQITDDWFFTGTYAYKQWNTGDEELGLAYAFAASDNPDGAAKGKFGKIKAGAFANATRCYLRKRDANVKLQQQNQAQQVAASPYVARYSINNLPETIDVEFVKDDEKGGRTVLHGRMNTVTGEFKMLRDYDLKGRKVNSTNRARGAYYGKKVMKK